MKVDLSIILVSYNSCNDTVSCITSIYEETKDIEFEIIVVDNASTDDSKAVVIDKFPEVVWLDYGYNSGFARANNMGIRHSKGSYILLLNTDTIILDSALRQCVLLMDKNTQVVASGIQLLNEDKTHQVSGAFFKKWGLNTLLPLPFLGSIVRWIGYKVKSKIPSIDRLKVDIEVDWIVGAFIMIRREIVTKNVLLDEDFFMYSEEIEWCSRLKKLGKLYLFHEPKIIHLGGASSKEFYKVDYQENGKNLWDRKGLQILLSNFVRIRKQYGILIFLFHMLFYIVEIPLFFFVSLFSTKIKFQNVKGYCYNLFYIAHVIPRIILNQPYFYKVNL